MTAAVYSNGFLILPSVSVGLGEEQLYAGCTSAPSGGCLERSVGVHVCLRVSFQTLLGLQSCGARFGHNYHCFAKCNQLTCRCEFPWSSRKSKVPLPRRVSGRSCGLMLVYAILG